MARNPSGKVNWFSDTEGFGFITSDDGNENLLVNRSSISGVTSLSVGEKVTYVRSSGNDRIAEATNVTAMGLPVECFKCGDLGHMGKNCPSPNNVCFGCNKEGHLQKDCTTSGMRCQICNNFGHKPKNCPQGGSGSGSGGSVT